MQKRKRKMRLLSMLLAVLMLCMTVFPTTAAAAEESATASTMQLMKTEGTVSVSNGTGRSLSVRDNMRLYNGYHAETEAKSYAWINLDDEKLSKLDEASAVDVLKSGKKLEMLLKSGNLYFNVTTPLTADETLNIRTSTMAVGVRGTSGWVKVLDRWTSEIYILEGTVQVSVEDPVSGQVKTAEVRGGQKAIAVAYPQEQVGDKCDIIMDKFGSGDIDGFVLVELVQDPGLCGKIYDETGMDVLGHIGHLDSIRRRLENIRDELGSLREQIEQGTVSADEAQPQLDEIHRQLDDLRRQLEELGPNAAARKRLDDAQEHLSQAQEALDNARTGDALDRLDDAREDLEDARGEMASDARTTGTATARERLARDQQELQDKLDDIEDQLAEQDHNVSDDPVWGDNPMPSPSPAPTGGGGGSTSRTIRDSMPKTDAEVQALLNEAGPRGTVTLLANDDPTNDDTTKNTLHITDTDREFNDTTEITVGSGQTLTLEPGIDVRIDDGCGLTVAGHMDGEGTLTNNGTVTVSSSNTLKMKSITSSGTIKNEDNGTIITDKMTVDSGSVTNSGRIEGRVAVGSGGTFTMDAGSGRSEVTSDDPDATITAETGATVVFNGGTITNSGDGFALDYESSARISIAGTVFRSVQDGVIAHEGVALEEPPDGYDPSTPGDDDKFYIKPGNLPGTGNPEDDEYEYPFIVTLTEGGAEVLPKDASAYYDYDSYTNPTVLTISTSTKLTIKSAANSDNKCRIALSNAKPVVNYDITLAGVNISTGRSAAFVVPDDYAGNVTITLKDGSVNELTSGSGYAGLQKNGTAANTGTLTITGGPNGTGSLTATGGGNATGIGGGASYNGVGSSSTGNYNNGEGSNITISGGIVTAAGGEGAAGIGSGMFRYGTNITITGGNVTATGGGNAAGIGGGSGGWGKNITISGGNVTASSGGNAPGIGGSGFGYGYGIHITGSAKVTSDSDTAIRVDKISELEIAATATVRAKSRAVVRPSIPTGFTVPAGKDADGYYWLRPDSDSSYDTGPFVVTGGTGGEDGDYTYINNVLSIKTNKRLTIRNADEYEGVSVPSPNRIEIAEENTQGANIVLAGVRIDVGSNTSPTTGRAAFLIPENYEHNVTITLADGSVNELISGSMYAGLQKNGTTGAGKLTIQAEPGGDGSGELTATSVNVTAVSGTGDGRGAGIGGSGWVSGTDNGSANITITGGTVTANGSGGYSSYGGAGIGGGGFGDATNITITGGKVTANGGGGTYGSGAGIGSGSGHGNNRHSGSKITITGGTVIATGGSAGTGGGAGIGGGVFGDGSDIRISDGDVTVTGGSGTYGIGSGIGGGLDGTSVRITITGGTITNNGDGYTVLAGNDSTTTVSNAVFKAKNDGGYFFVDNSGGGWNPEGYDVTGPDDEGYYWLSPELLGTEYEATDADTLLAAFGSARGGDTILLENDIEIEPAEVIEISYGTRTGPIVLDLNGYKLTVTGSNGITVTGGTLRIRGDSAGGGELELEGALRVQDSAYLILDSGTITGAGDFYIPYLNKSTFTINGGVVNGYISANESSTINMEGGVINGGNTYGGGNVVLNTSTFNMRGGTINSGTSDTYGIYAVDVNSRSDFIMTDGTINGIEETAVTVNNGGIFTLNGGNIVSTSSYAAITCGSNNGALILNGGTVTSDNAAGYVIAGSEAPIAVTFGNAAVRGKKEALFGTGTIYTNEPWWPDASYSSVLGTGNYYYLTVNGKIVGNIN